MSFGKRLREFRMELGYKQIDFAKEIGVKPQALYKYEKGLIETSDVTKRILTEKFNLSIDWLLTGKGEKFIRDKSKTPISLKQTLPILNEIAELEEKSKDQILDFVKSLRSDTFIPVSQVAEPSSKYGSEN